MKNIISKIIVVVGELLCIIGLFPIILIYPGKGWTPPITYWIYIFSNKHDLLWKLALVVICIGILFSFKVRHNNRIKILTYSFLAVIVSFATACLQVYHLAPSSWIILYPISIALFIIAIVYTLKAKIA